MTDLDAMESDIDSLKERIDELERRERRLEHDLEGQARASMGEILERGRRIEELERELNLWTVALDQLFSARQDVLTEGQRANTFAAERDTLLEDKARMDYLEGEEYREECWRDAGMPGAAPDSLFRHNLPITRERVDEARKALEGE